MFWFLFSVIIFTLTYISTIPRFRTIGQILLVLSLAYVTGMGSLVGTDHYNYVSWFYRINSLSDVFNIDFEEFAKSKEQEIGFGFLIYISHFLGLGEAGFFFLMSIVINFCIVKSLFRFSNPYIAMLAFITSIVYFQQTNLLRQSIAVAIFVYSLQYLNYKKWYYYIIFLMFAVSIHTSAIILFPLLFLAFVNYERHYKAIKIILFTLWIISLFASLGMFNIINSFIDLIVLVQNNTMYEYSYNDNLGSTISFDIVFNLIALYAIFVHKNDSRSLPYLVCIVLAAVMLNISITLPVVRRIAYYFMTPSIVYLGGLLSIKKISSNYNFIRAVMIALIIVVYGIKDLVLNFMIIGRSLLGTQFYSLQEILVG